MAPVDLRSDTVTRPSPEMRAAMAAAEVGDDVFGEDPTVQALEARAADWVGHDAALFLPSGTMGNQIAMLAHCQRGDDVVVGEGAHSVLYESGGGGALAGVQFTVCGRGGHFSADELTACLRSEDPSGHVAPTGLVMVENTHNRAGGAVFPLEDLAAISALCRSNGARLHMDGARIFNACVASGLEPARYVAVVDTLCFCLSKGL
ncbi:MAG: threonine aldolase family protein, partial [Myxococcales bacterium]|nr:threonine aldolase family protein [Myxococcales bacterium]